MSNYPKYVEFDNGEVVIFSNIEQHSDVARRVAATPVSAGFVSFPSAPDESLSFFGNSTSLKLQANPLLQVSGAQLFGGKKECRYPTFFFSNSEGLARRLVHSAQAAALKLFVDEYGSRLLLPFAEGACVRDIALFSGYFDGFGVVRMLD